MLILDFARSLSGGFRVRGRYRACGAHLSAVHSVCGFCGNSSPSLKTVFTKRFLRRYEEYLTQLGRKRNTISFYMSRLRSLYHIAVDMKLVKYVPDLFSEVFTGNDPTEKRAVSAEVIAVLQSADLSGNSRLERCRDLFMLSFYLQGMSFVDLAYLRKSDIGTHSIMYRRHKTGSQVTVSISREARDILDKYKDETNSSIYALPILTLTGEKGYCQYESALHRHNRQLKALARHLDIPDNLTSYVARHSWATIAYHSGVRVSVVSQAMGHQTEEITHIYFESFGPKQLAEANRMVMEAVLQAGELACNTKSRRNRNTKGEMSVTTNPEAYMYASQRMKPKNKKRRSHNGSGRRRYK